MDFTILENLSGKSLLKKMGAAFWKEEDLQVVTQKNEKPKAFLNESEVSVSFSHTNGGVSAAISKSFNVGCDMEVVGRSVHPGLLERIKNSRENGALYRDVAPVRIWTLKEAALKMIGTGLRKPMNRVQIRFVNENEFDVEFDDGKQAKICSFQYKDHWISVCYQKFSIV